MRLPQPPLSCPVCEEPLERRDAAFACGNGHSFDVAKDGYVNLLPAQHKSRGIEGDVREMLAARRRFLDAGYFDPLTSAISGAVASTLDARADRTPGVVVEVGCGEGHYVGAACTSLGDDRAVWLGTDLSKDAVRMAAKRHRHVLFFVADVHKRLYLRDASVAVLLDVFAPRDAAEFARVLEPGGTALVAIPMPAHLASLRDALGLLDVEPDKEPKTLARFAEGFRLADRREIAFSLRLPPSAVKDLVEMGPNRWHGKAGDVEREMETEAAVVVLRLERL